MSVAFSISLIKEYQAEMYSTYGVLVNDNDAHTQLRTLANALFPTPDASQGGVEKVANQSGLPPDCDRSHPAAIG